MGVNVNVHIFYREPLFVISFTFKELLAYLLGRGTKTSAVLQAVRKSELKKLNLSDQLMLHDKLLQHFPEIRLAYFLEFIVNPCSWFLYIDHPFQIDRCSDND